MHRYFSASIVIYFLFFSGCRQKEELDSEDNNTVVIPISLNDSKEWVFDDFFEVKKTILLDSKSLVAEINKLVFHDNQIFILDQKQKSILKFSSDGHLQKKFYFLGKGPQEYSDITDFIIDYKTGDIIILDGVVGQQLVRYDKNGNFINKKRISFDCSNFFQTQNGYIVYCGNHRSKENLINDNFFGNVVVCDSNFHVYEKQLPISSIWNGRRYLFKNITAFSKYGKSVFCQIPMPNNNTIFEIKNNSLEPKYRFDFGNNNLANLLTESKSLKRILSEIEKSQLAHNLNSYFENEQMIYFAVMKGEKVHQIIYDKTTKESFDRIVDIDKLDSHFFPTEYQGDGTFLVHTLLPFLISDHELEGYLPNEIKDNTELSGNPILIFLKIKNRNTN